MRELNIINEHHGKVKRISIKEKSSAELAKFTTTFRNRINSFTPFLNLPKPQHTIYGSIFVVKPTHIHIVLLLPTRMYQM